ncbi:hypothetical protein F9C07_2283815 [Aspergillus flavus]|uniref:Uncharacterized protein n=2 Tax=Aspergillus subgen. Circumdati TaxID=2720871 RepID=A0A7U2R042_ASPFN|nr:hypothetical protein F9C07_2283815 [Aspergillus flavus]
MYSSFLQDNMYGEVSTLDHIIAQHGLRTVKIEQLPSSLQKSKTEPPPTIEDLQREIGRLRQELAFHQDVQVAFIKLLDDSREAYRLIQEALRTATIPNHPDYTTTMLCLTVRKTGFMIKSALRQVSERLSASEVQLLNSYGIFMDDTFLDDHTIL